MSLKEFVVEHVKFDEYYAKSFPGWNTRNRCNVRCLWHDDQGKPNLSIGLKNGGAKCHKCGKALGNIVHFESEARNITEEQAALSIYERHLHQTFSKIEIERYERKLTDKFRSWIRTDCGLSEESIKRFHLGLDTKSHRVTIPIQDAFNNYTNLRYYQLPRHRTASTSAKIFNAKGYGYLELFPWAAIKKFTPRHPVFMMKAEKDTMLALQMGLQAFCVTNGERAWNDEWDDLFEDYHVGICLDQDETGKAGAEKKFNILQGHTKSVCIIAIPFRRKSSLLKDFADWVLRENGTKVGFLSIYNKVRNPPSSKKIPPSEKTIETPDHYSHDYVNLIDVGRNVDMMNMVIKVKGIVAAKMDKTYTIPYKFYVSSTSCPQKEWQIPIGRELLRLIRSSDDQIIDFVKKDLLKSAKVKLEPIEYVTVSEVEVIPVASIEGDAPYITQRCFFFGRHIEANVPYDLEIIPTTEIRTQETVGIIIKAKPISLSIEEFVFDESHLKVLEQFHPEGGVWDSVCNMANEVSLQYTRIYNRIDWHIVALLSYACPLQFNFPNEGLQRGWLNSLALGDTQTGKSQVTNALQKVFNCGAIINAENCTYVGLVGGAVKMGSGQFMLRWGRIPLSNKQLVVIEELSGLSITEISNMSDVRSSGIARLDKGGLSSETFARTRLICLSNVRGRDRDLAGSASGVRAVQELIGHGEDIARFDLIVTLTDSEVSTAVINQALYNQETIGGLDQNHLRLLIQFIWALKPEQILFTKEAYLRCLEQTKNLSFLYHPSIPIFKGGSGRLKIARIACAIACLQFSWDWKAQKIVVNAEHIDAAIALLQMLYDKASLGYRAYSDQMHYRDSVRSLDELNAEFKSVVTLPQRRYEVLQYLIHSTKFTRDELCQVASLQIINADRLIGRMIASNILNKGIANVWEVTSKGLDWMHKSLQLLNGSTNGSIKSSIRSAKHSDSLIHKNRGLSISSKLSGRA